MIEQGAKVGVLMSGGVDSSVAAALLKEAGYDVVGITLQLWDYENAASKPIGERGCCDISQQIDARSVAAKLGIRHYVIDLREAFEEQVILPYERAYLTGTTPNPCVLCNSKLKWGAVLARTDQLGLDAIATGHYARIEHTEDGPRLRKAVDEKKDQSYALWQVPRDALAKTLLPLGEWTKDKIRQYAAEHGFVNADKPDSQEVCFIPSRYDEYLRDRYPEETGEIGKGEIVDGEGNRRGKHDGFFSFTIGQRRGLDISDGQGPYYVTDVDAENNRVVVGGNSDLLNAGMYITGTNWILGDAPQQPEECLVKVRYNDSSFTPATIMPADEKGRFEVRFETAVRAVTPGQSAVLYRGDKVWGGGIIARAIRQDSDSGDLHQAV